MSEGSVPFPLQVICTRFLRLELPISRSDTISLFPFTFFIKKYDDWLKGEKREWYTELFHHNTQKLSVATGTATQPLVLTCYITCYNARCLEEGISVTRILTHDSAGLHCFRTEVPSIKLYFRH